MCRNVPSVSSALITCKAWGCFVQFIHTLSLNGVLLRGRQNSTPNWVHAYNGVKISYEVISLTYLHLEDAFIDQLMTFLRHFKLSFGNVPRTSCKSQRFNNRLQIASTQLLKLHKVWMICPGTSGNFCLFFVNKLSKDVIPQLTSKWTCIAQFRPRGKVPFTVTRDPQLVFLCDSSSSHTITHQRVCMWQVPLSPQTAGLGTAVILTESHSYKYLHIATASSRFYSPAPPHLNYWL